MKFKNLNFRKINNVVFRYANDSDKDTVNNKIDSNYIMFVNTKDVDADRHNEPEKFSNLLNESSAIPCSGHSLTNMMYGESKFVKRNTLNLSGFYKETPVYLARSGQVFKAIIRFDATENEYLNENS